MWKLFQEDRAGLRLIHRPDNVSLWLACESQVDSSSLERLVLLEEEITPMAASILQVKLDWFQ